LKNAGKSGKIVCVGKYLILLEEVCTFLALSAHTLASVRVAVDCDGLEELNFFCHLIYSFHHCFQVFAMTPYIFAVTRAIQVSAVTRAIQVL
jgi:hypothetical protein